jgi:hypothetical protein
MSFSSPLQAALERAITRLKEEPRTVLFEKEPNYPEGLNIGEINRRAGCLIFIDIKESDQRLLIVNHPDGLDIARWVIWDKFRGHDALDPEKLERTVRYLQLWASLDDDRDQAGKGQAEGDRANPEQATKATDEKKLSPSRKIAYQQFEWAVRTNAALDGATDRTVYDWLKEHLEEDEANALPAYSTWTRYLSDARAAYNTRKHNSRAGRETGRSTVRPDEI